MPKIRLRFTSILVTFTKERESEMEIPAGGTVNTVLEALHHKYSNEEGARMFENKGRMNHVLVILVNGTDIRRMEGLDTELHEDDLIVFLPIIAGG